MSTGHVVRESQAARTLARNVVVNLLSLGLPVAVGVFTIPILLEELGTEKFGFLTIAWALIGYFSLFDLGLGRAMTQTVAARIGAGRASDIPGLFWTTLLLMAGFSFLGALAVYAIAPSLVDVLHIQTSSRGDALAAFQVLAVSIPCVAVASGLIGFLTAYGRFGLIASLRIPMGIASYVTPLLVLPVSHSLLSVCLSLALARGLFMLLYGWACLSVAPGLSANCSFAVNEVRSLLRYGGWITVTNFIGPVMTYMDRFIVGAVLTLTATAYYVTPYELVTRLGLLPMALVGVLFPAFAAGLNSDRARAGRLYRICLTLVQLLMTPITVCLLMFSRDGLAWWLGESFAHFSTPVLQWLAVGVLLNSIAQVPFTLIQAAGHSDLTAKLHMIELPIYLAGIWALIGLFGVTGAAIAWTLRVGLDMVALIWIARKMLPGSIRDVAPAFALMGAVLAMAYGASDIPWLAKSALCTFLCAAYALGVWSWLVEPSERRSLLSAFHRTGTSKAI